MEGTALLIPDLGRHPALLLHKKPTEAHRPSVLVTTGILRPQDSPPLNGDWIEGIERVCEWRRDFAATSY